MRQSVFSLLALILLILPPISVADEPLDVSMVSLIATPQQYEGKLIRVIAFLHIDFEGDALYLHRDDYLHGIAKNGIWIELLGQMGEKYKALSDHYVIAEGIFDAKSKGHFGMWSGTLKSVQRLEGWR